MQITYRCSAMDHLRCFGKMMQLKPMSILVSIGVVLLLALRSASSGGFSVTKLLFSLGSLFVIVALVLTVTMVQKSLRSCTSIVWYDGIHDLTPEKRTVIRWADILSIQDIAGDVYIVCKGMQAFYIPRSGFTAGLTASTFLEAACRARQGDYSMIVPPPQPVPAYQQPSTDQNSGVWPPPPQL